MMPKRLCSLRNHFWWNILIKFHICWSVVWMLVKMCLFIIEMFCLFILVWGYANCELKIFSATFVCVCDHLLFWCVDCFLFTISAFLICDLALCKLSRFHIFWEHFISSVTIDQWIYIKEEDSYFVVLQVLNISMFKRQNYANLVKVDLKIISCKNTLEKNIK